MSKAMWAKYEKMRDEAIAAAHARGVREGLLKAAEILEQKYGDTPGAVPYSGLRDIRLLAERGGGS